MGSGQSTPEEDSYGYHVLQVMSGSPAEKAGIEPFFDFLVGINQTRLADEDTEELVRHLTENKGRQVILHVYSSKDNALREVKLVPTDNWGGGIKSSLIGCSIRFCSYQSAAENVWHILDVAADSPASIAGLQPFTDYIVGAPRVTLTSQDDFYGLVERHNGQEMRLHVYNTNWDSCREVMIVPNREWGGQGSLGCDVGYGYLHRIPARNPRRGSFQHLRKVDEEVEPVVPVVNTAVTVAEPSEPSPPRTAPARYKPPVLKKKYTQSGLGGSPVAATNSAGDDPELMGGGDTDDADAQTSGASDGAQSEKAGELGPLHPPDTPAISEHHDQPHDDTPPQVPKDGKPDVSPTRAQANDRISSDSAATVPATADNVPQAPTSNGDHSVPAAPADRPTPSPKPLDTSSLDSTANRSAPTSAGSGRRSPKKSTSASKIPQPIPYGDTSALLEQLAIDNRSPGSHTQKT